MQGHLGIAELAISTLDMRMSDSALRTIVIARSATYAPAIPYRMSVPVARDGAHRTYTGANAAAVTAIGVIPILTVKTLEGRHRFHTYTHKTIRNRWRRDVASPCRNIGGDSIHVVGDILGIGCLDLSADIVEHKVVIHHLDTVGISDLQATMTRLTAGDVQAETRSHPTGIHHKKIVGTDIRRLEKSLDRSGHTPRMCRRDYTYGIVRPDTRWRLERRSYAEYTTISLCLRNVPRHSQRIPRCRKAEYNHTAKLSIGMLSAKNNFIILKTAKRVPSGLNIRPHRRSIGQKTIKSER